MVVIHCQCLNVEDGFISQFAIDKSSTYPPLTLGDAEGFTGCLKDLDLSIEKVSIITTGPGLKESWMRCYGTTNG